MRILNIGSGTGIFNQGCEDQARMIEYGKMVERFDTLISCEGNYSNLKLGDNVFIHATNSKNRYFRLFDMIRLGDKMMKKNNTDVIFCQDPLINGLVGLYLAKKYRAKLAISVFGTSIFDIYWKKERWYNFILKYIGILVMNNADLIQTDGFGNFEVLKDKYGAKVFWKPIVPSDIDKYVVENKDFVDGVTRILFVGRMAKQKNIKMLASVIEKVAKRDFENKVQFFIAGDGGERHRLDALADLPNVKMINNCNREELNQLYKNSDILIMTSYYEGFPRVFMEAAANGLAFVVTNVSGAKNIVEHGKNGYIIEQENENEFIDKLCSLINNADLLKDFSKYTLNNFSKKYYYKLSTDIHQKIINFLS